MLKEIADLNIAHDDGFNIFCNKSIEKTKIEFMNDGQQLPFDGIVMNAEPVYVALAEEDGAQLEDRKSEEGVLLEEKKSEEDEMTLRDIKLGDLD